MRGTKTEISPGTWRLRVYAGRRPSGSPIYVSKTVKTGNGKPMSGSRAADDELAALITQVNKGQVTAHTVTVSSLLARWLDHTESIGRSATTVREYRRIAEKTVNPAIGLIKLSKLRASNLDALYATMTAKGNKPATVRRVHALISAALHQAEKWDLVEQSVARKATPPPVHADEVVAPSPADVKKLIAAAEADEPVFGSMVTIAATTGARRGELCGLRWSDIDWASGTLSVERSIYETKGGGFEVKTTKTHQGRRITLDPFALEVLRRRRAEVDALARELKLTVPESAYLFSQSPQGGEPIRPDVITKATIRAAGKAEIKTHLHALRHFSATTQIAGGIDPVTVANRLGHRDSSVTLRVYSHALQQRDRDAAALVGSALS